MIRAALGAAIGAILVFCAAPAFAGGSVQAGTPRTEIHAVPSAAPKVAPVQTKGLIDHRALDSETALAGPAAARSPEDDLVSLQLIVDGLYLDPVTYQPSAARRESDAKNFAKGLR